MLLYSPSWLETHFVHQAGLELLRNQDVSVCCFNRPLGKRTVREIFIGCL